jgi:transcriptional regulator with XRE-family HTH domain
MVDDNSPKRSNREPATLADVIHDAREAAGLSIRQLAPLVGIHHSVLARIERGEVTKPSPELLQNIAEVTETDAARLLAFIGVKATLPEPKVYFRRAYGMTEDEANEAARMIEERYGSSTQAKRQSSDSG